MRCNLVTATIVLAAGVRPAPADDHGAEPASAAPVLATIERTACFGQCPEFVITVRTDGAVEWLGRAHVHAIGPRTATLSRRQLRSLIAAFTRARFSELDDRGRVPRPRVCHAVAGGLALCEASGDVSMCSDLSHTILTFDRGGTHHRVDDAHCDSAPALERLEATVLARVGAKAWL